MRRDTHSPEETRAFGERLARQLAAGDVLLLHGQLGAGKSELTRGIARGLGIGGYVTSPSFTILQVHTGGRLPLYHFDWYRLSDVEELYELSMDEYLYDAGVAVVEWPDIALEAVPEKRLEITIDVLGDTDRGITLTLVGGYRALDEAALEAMA
jgi:tRNA threonylcarbamoyladenosine biosynthesis protein TsaE